jgi:hypothetical protein
MDLLGQVSSTSVGRDRLRRAAATGRNQRAAESDLKCELATGVVQRLWQGA